MADFCDPRGGVVHSDRIEGRFRRTGDNARAFGEKAVRAVILIDAGQDRRRTRAGNRTQQAHRHQLGGKSHRLSRGTDQLCDPAEKSGRTEHTDREQQRDHGRRDEHHCAHALLDALDKARKNIYPFEKPVDAQRRDDERDDDLHVSLLLRESIFDDNSAAVSASAEVSHTHSKMSKGCCEP